MQCKGRPVATPVEPVCDLNFSIRALTAEIRLYEGDCKHFLQDPTVIMLKHLEHSGSFLLRAQCEFPKIPAGFTNVSTVPKNEHQCHWCCTASLPDVTLIKKTVQVSFSTLSFFLGAIPSNLSVLCCRQRHMKQDWLDAEQHNHQQKQQNGCTLARSSQGRADRGVHQTSIP